MKKINFLLLTILLVELFSCKDDCDTITYKNHTVDFYTTHQDFILTPPIFDTITEMVLEKEAHLEGAVFETVTEQILVKEGFNKYRIMDSVLVQIITDAETELISEFYCYHFLDDTDFTTVTFPAEYTTRTSQRVVQPGTGAEIPATYSTVTKIILDTPPQILPNTGDRQYQRKTFKIPEARTIRGHLKYYFERQSIQDCHEGNSYIIQE